MKKGSRRAVKPAPPKRAAPELTLDFLLGRMAVALEDPAMLRTQLPRYALDALRYKHELEAAKNAGNAGLPAYVRPEALLDWQGDTIDLMLAEDTALKGSRRTGKSLLDAVAAFEHLYALRDKYPNGEIYVLSGKQDQAKIVLDKLYDPAVYPAIQPYIAKRTQYEVELTWGAKILAVAPTSASTRGGEMVGLITDEAAIANPVSIAEILPAGDTIPEFRWWMSGTPQTGGMFHMACNDPAAWQFTLVEITDDMCTWIAEGNRHKTRARLTLLQGEQFAMQELDGLFVQGELFFPPAEVDLAFEQDPATYPTEFDRVEGGIDMGRGHELAVFALGEKRGRYYELGCNGYTGKGNWTKASAFAKTLHEKFGCTFNVESNSGGQEFADRLEEIGVPAECVQWGGFESGASNSKSIPFAMIKLAMEKGEISLHDPKLQTQTYNYKGDKKNDDRVDALALAMWRYAGSAWMAGV